MSIFSMASARVHPGRATVAKPNCTLAEAIENIDIGGPSLIRASAKNNKHVTVVVDPADYPVLAKELKENKGVISVQTNFRLARKAFEHTHHYDGAIAKYLAGVKV